MRNYLALLSLLICPWPHLALAQAPSPDSSALPDLTPAGVVQADENPDQSPAVILKPIRPDSKFDMALIDDVCVHSKRQAQVYQFKHAAVEEVAELINQWLKTKLNAKGAKVDGFICNAPVIIVPEVATNSLIVSVAADFEDANTLQEIIESLDRASNTIEIEAVLKKTANGRTEVLAVPSLIVSENNTASVTVDTKEGQLTIELTARVVKGESLMQTQPRTAQQPTDKARTK